jgi:D-alanine-D-alanine ligase
MTTPSKIDAQSGAKIRVAVVFGGRSSEHAISCVTAAAVMAALDKDKYEVIPVGIAGDGRWVLESNDPQRFAISSPENLPSVDSSLSAVALLRAGAGAELIVHEASAAPRQLGEVDVVFPLLHGPWGEDGTIQGMLEMAGVRYVGAGVLASAVSMDKAYMKVVLQAAGLPVTPWVSFSKSEWVRDSRICQQRAEDTLAYPMFVKPCRAGSSMGISKIHHPSEFESCVEAAMEHDPRILIESALLDAREIECGVLGTMDGGAEASVCAEVRISPDHEFYDFAAKYLPGEHTQLDVPADVPANVASQIQELSLRTFFAVGGEGLARVDFFLLPEGGLVVNEINTMPGFTPTSMYPLMWEKSGIPYSELVDRLISLALARSTGLR